MRCDFSHIFGILPRFLQNTEELCKLAAEWSSIFERNNSLLFRLQYLKTLDAVGANDKIDKISTGGIVLNGGIAIIWRSKKRFAPVFNSRRCVNGITEAVQDCKDQTVRVNHIKVIPRISG